MVSSWHGDVDGARTETVLPSGRAMLVIVAEDAAPACGGWAVVHGPSWRRRSVRVRGWCRAVGVDLAAGAGLFDSEVHAWADESVPLRAMFGSSDAGALLSAVRQADSSEVARDAVVEFIGGRLRDWLSTEWVLVRSAEEMLDAGATVAAVASTLDIDRRALAVVFKRRIGLGLKQYARVRRFARAVSAARHPAASSLSAIAIDCGYSDQAHMTRDFAFFAGFSPGVVHRNIGPTPMHVVHDEMFKTPTATVR